MARDERERLETVYGEYASDPARRRAWDGDNPGNRAMRDELVARLLPAVPVEGEILDVGCGTGWWLERLASEVGAERLHGVDLIAKRVDAASRRTPGATVTAGDARQLPYEEGRFALVTLLVVLSSMPSPDGVLAALGEARRVTAPGGHVAVWDLRWPSRNPHVRRISRQLLDEALPGAAHAPITLLPPIARRLPGPRVLAQARRLRLLRSHRLTTWRAPSTGRDPAGTPARAPT